MFRIRSRVGKFATVLSDQENTDLPIFLYPQRIFNTGKCTRLPTVSGVKTESVYSIIKIKGDWKKLENLEHLNCMSAYHT